MPTQQYLPGILGIGPTNRQDTAAVPTRRTQTDRWAANLMVARQFCARKGHLVAPRKHVEVISVGEGGGSQEEVVKLGAFLDNTVGGLRS